MKNLLIKDLEPANLNWLMQALESTQAGDTVNAKFKGRCMIMVANLMEAEDLIPPKLKGVKK